MAEMVSTITPCFNMKRYLRRFLEELPLQTYFEHLEVVLDHNAPDEEEIQWVRDFQARFPDRLQHIIVEEVDPLAISMNRCIAQSKGSLLAIWNVDDLRTPDSLERQVRTLSKDPSIGITYGSFIMVEKFGSREGDLWDLSHFRSNQITRTMMCGPFFMFRKELTERAGMFDEQLRIVADHDLQIRLGMHAQIALTPGILGYYLNERQGASTRGSQLLSVERSLVNLRYGVYDKLDFRSLHDVVNYRITEILQEGEFRDVAEFVPDYTKLVADRTRELLLIGVLRQVEREVTDKLRRAGGAALYRSLMDALHHRLPRAWGLLHRAKIIFRNRILFR